MVSPPCERGVMCSIENGSDEKRTWLWQYSQHPSARGARPRTGYIGLQNHDDYARGKETHVYFKEVSVRGL